MTSGSAGASNTMERVAPAAPRRAQEARSPQREPAAASYTATSAEARPDPAWDALVEAAPGGDLVQTTAWAATRQRLGYRVCHLRLSAADGTPVGGCLIQSRRVLPGIWTGAVPRGPLVFTERPGAAERVVREMVAAARRLGIRLLVVQPPEGSAPPLLDAMAAAGFRAGGLNIMNNATIRIDLRRPEEEILRNMNSNRRRAVRAGMRSGLETSSSEDVETFHRLHAATAKRQGFRPIGIEELKAQWEVLAPLGRCRIFITRHGGVPVAGEWMMSFAGVLTNKFKGYDPPLASPGAKQAPTASMWACLLWARREGFHSLDFLGFDRKTAEDLLAGRKPAAEFMKSVAYFKWSFGGEVALLPQAQFLFTGRLARFALGVVVHRLATSRSIRPLARRMRAWMRARGLGRISAPAAAQRVSQAAATGHPPPPNDPASRSTARGGRERAP